jgi:hypothetical protein
LGAPSVADGRDFDEVRTSSDALFEVVHVHFWGARTLVFRESSDGDFTWMSRPIKRNGSRKGYPQIALEGSSADPAEEKSALSGCPQDFHVRSTAFPQMSPELVVPGPRPEGRMTVST